MKNSFIKKTVEYFWYLFIFLLPWQTRWIAHEREINGGYWEYGTYSVYATDILFFLFIIFCAVEWMLEKRKGKQEGWRLNFFSTKHFWFFITVFDLWVFLSIFWAEDWKLGLYSYARILQGLVLSLIIFARGFERVKTIIAFLAAALVQSLFAFWQFFSQEAVASKWFGVARHLPYELGQFVIENESGRYLRPYGSFEHPNILGGFLAIAFMLGISLWYSAFLKKENLRTRVLLFFTLAVIGGGLILSFSKSAWLGFFIGLLSFFIFRRRQKFRNTYDAEMRKIRRWYFLSLAVVFILLAIIFQDLLFTRMQGNERLEIQSYMERKSQYREAASLFSQSPTLGWGIGNYTAALFHNSTLQKSSYEYQPTHNIFLLIAAELGVPGLGLFLLAIILYPFFFFFSSLKRIRVGETAFFVSFSLVAVVFSIGFFDHYFWTLQSGRWMMFFVLGWLWRDVFLLRA